MATDRKHPMPVALLYDPSPDLERWDHWDVLSADEAKQRWDPPFEVVPVVPAVLTDEKVEKVARAIAETCPRCGPLPGAVEGIRRTYRDPCVTCKTAAHLALEAAGSVSEPSTGGDDA